MSVQTASIIQAAAMQSNGGIKAVTVSIIIPAYNEEAGLPLVLSNLSKLEDKMYEIIVVDDGS